MIPTEQKEFLTKLITLYDSPMADAVIHCYLEFSLLKQFKSKL